MRYWLLVSLLALAACEEKLTPEGCPIRYGEFGQVYTQACVAAYYEDMARSKGAPITRCFKAVDGSVTCTTQ